MEDKVYLVSIDLSTTCTGIAYFGRSGELLGFDKVKSSSKGLTKLEYPFKQLEKMERMADDVISTLVNNCPSVEVIVIEEIAGSRQRLGQKTLDGVHWSLVRRLRDLKYDKNVYYYDVTGAKGWRTHLNLKLSQADKLDNKQARQLNKRISKKSDQLPIINPKKLAERYVNDEFSLKLDIWEDKSDEDVADAIAMGDAFFKTRILI